MTAATGVNAHGGGAEHRPGRRVPLLFLAPNTGGGHRSAALAVRDALERDYPSRFAPVLFDPLTGPSAPWVVRRLTTLYAPITRRAPSLWGVLYRASDSGGVMRTLQRTLFSRTGRTIKTAIEDVQPAMVVSFHALTSEPSRKAARCLENAPALVTVVTDLVAVHSAWRTGEPDCVVAPSASVARRFQLDGVASERVIDTGLPVATELGSGPLAGKARAAHRRALGLGAKTFVVLVAGGAEGTGRLGRQVRALARCGLEGLEVVAICGRNQRVEAQVRRIQARGKPTRVWVKGFVNNMADWLRCADVVVTRAGPGMLAEATCAGAPLLITSHLPGQEEGNTELAVVAGAARYTPTPRDLVREIDHLRRDPMALRSMRQASARLGRPGAASEVASLLAALAAPVPGQSEVIEAVVLPA